MIWPEFAEVPCEFRLRSWRYTAWHDSTKGMELNSRLFTFN
jgi:hypothetical protein